MSGLKYRRNMRFKHINRKKRIIKQHNNYWHYKYEGELDSGKIHCSCDLCSSKTKNKGRHKRHIPSYNPSINDRKRNEAMDFSEKENLLIKAEPVPCYYCMNKSFDNCMSCDKELFEEKYHDWLNNPYLTNF